MIGVLSLKLDSIFVTGCDELVGNTPDVDVESCDVDVIVMYIVVVGENVDIDCFDVPVLCVVLVDGRLVVDMVVVGNDFVTDSFVELDG